MKLAFSSCLRKSRMRHIYPVTVGFFIVGCSTLFGQSGLSITSYQFVSEVPKTLTLWTITYNATLTNSGGAVGPITGILTGTGPGAQITPLSTVWFPAVPANGQVNGTFSILVNRTSNPPFSLAKLQWALYNTVSISSCGYAITSPGGYTISGNLSSSDPTNPCITVSSVMSGPGVTINGNSYTLSNSSDTPASLLSIQNTGVSVTYQNMTFQFTGPGVNSAFPLVMVSNSSTTSAPGVTSMSNTYQNGWLGCDESSFFASNSDRFSNAYTDVACPSVSLTGGNYNLSGVTTVQAGAILLGPGSDQALVANNTIVGNISYVDDGIDVGASAQGDQISYNTISNVFDCGIEFVGLINGATVANNVITNAGNYAVGAFWGDGSIPLQITGSTFTGNSANGSGYHWGLFGFGPTQQSLQSGSQFTDNTISNNTAPGSNTDAFGGPATMFGTTSGNTLANNNLGGSAYIYFYPSTGYADGGGNVCGFLIPGPNGNPITCQ